jgi:hypothetical protein
MTEPLGRRQPDDRQATRLRTHQSSARLAALLAGAILAGCGNQQLSPGIRYQFSHSLAPATGHSCPLAIRYDGTLTAEFSAIRGGAVDCYLVTLEEWRKWQDDQSFSSLDRMLGRLEGQVSAKVSPGDYVVLFENKGSEPIRLEASFLLTRP